LDARLTTLLLKSVIAKSREVETGRSYFKTNLADSSKEDCGWERSVLPVVVIEMMMMMMMIDCRVGSLLRIRSLLRQ
jgi:hypothetical protein